MRFNEHINLGNGNYQHAQAELSDDLPNWDHTQLQDTDADGMPLDITRPLCQTTDTEPDKREW